MNLSSNDGIGHGGTITSYTGVLKHLLRRYVTNAMIAKADEETRNFRKASLTP